MTSSHRYLRARSKIPLGSGRSQRYFAKAKAVWSQSVEHSAANQSGHAQTIEAPSRVLHLCTHQCTCTPRQKPVTNAFVERHIYTWFRSSSCSHSNFPDQDLSNTLLVMCSPRLVWGLYLVVFASQVVANVQDDALLLLAPWADALGWSSTRPTCLWTGVACEGADAKLL